eukprot:scaffold5330_cov59-Phaeocystis_antarctica.AAC.5
MPARRRASRAGRRGTARPPATRAGAAVTRTRSARRARAPSLCRRGVVPPGPSGAGSVPRPSSC